MTLEFKRKNKQGFIKEETKIVVNVKYVNAYLLWQLSLM